jgi:hypothetical protein
MTRRPGPRVRDWAAAFGGDEEAHYRGRRFTPHMAVRLLRPRRPTPKVYDSWARAPVSETGPLLSAEMERRTTAGGGSLLAWRFAFFALGDPHTSCMTCKPGPPCHRLGRIGARRARFSAVSRGASKGVFLEKGFTPRAAITISHFLPTVAPFCLRALRAPLHFRSSAFHRRSRHGLASPSRALPVRGGTQPGVQPARMGRAGASPHGDLAAGELVLFISFLSCGLTLPISPFFLLLLLEELSLQLQHLTPHSILQATIFAHLCEMFVGVALLLPALGRKGVAQRPSRDGKRTELWLHLSRELHQHLMVCLHELV